MYNCTPSDAMDVAGDSAAAKDSSLWQGLESAEKQRAEGGEWSEDVLTPGCGIGDREGDTGRDQKAEMVDV